jgi:hypothetical protein
MLNATHEIQKTDWKSGMEMLTLDRPKSWRLIQKRPLETKDEPLEELIFTVRGILCAKDLPPVNEKPGSVTTLYDTGQ